MGNLEKLVQISYIKAARIGPIVWWVNDHKFFHVLHCCLSEFNYIRSLIAECITKKGG